MQHAKCVSGVVRHRSSHQQRSWGSPQQLGTCVQAIEVMTAGKASGLDEIETEASQVPAILQRTIAVYYAAKALIGELSPGFDELAKVCQPPFPGPCWGGSFSTLRHCKCCYGLICTGTCHCCRM